MFGFLKPPLRTLAYRTAYARCCQYQRLRYGCLAGLAVSYEAVFLYILAGESGRFALADLPAQWCCRLRTSGKLARAEDAAVGAFCGAFGLMLGALKIQDDLRDHERLRGRLGRLLLKRAFGQAYGYFAQRIGDFASTVEGLVRDHLRLEDRQRPVPIEHYVRPTAQAFGYCFGWLPRCVGGRPDQAALHGIGSHVGAALVSFDCAVDWERDRRHGQFNPLVDLDDVRAALEYSRGELRRAATLCQEFIGRRALSAAILGSVARRVAQKTATAHEPTPSTWVQRLSERWRARRDPRAVYLRMDCCCDAADGLDCCCDVTFCDDVDCCCCITGSICPSSGPHSKRSAKTARRRRKRPAPEEPPPEAEAS